MSAPPPPPPPGSGRVSHLINVTTQAAANFNLRECHEDVPLQDRDLVKKLTEDPANKGTWDTLLANGFCEAMKEARKDDPNVFRGFIYYMKQDYHYVANLISYALTRLSKAETADEHRERLAELSQAKAYTEHFFSMCTSPWPNGLGIDARELLATKKSKALQGFIDLFNSEAQKKDPVLSALVNIGPIQSYFRLAEDVYLNSKYNDTIWYKFWAEENIGIGKHALIQRRFFIDTDKQWGGHYNDASAVFKKTCELELALWNEALKHSDPNV